MLRNQTRKPTTNMTTAVTPPVSIITITTTTVHCYKPLAIRLPCLITFLAMFSLSISLIERQLAQSGHSEHPQSTSSSATSSSGEQKTLFCSQPAQFSGQLASLESRYSSMCSNFSEIFAPFPTSKVPSLQAVFREWSESFSSVTDARSAVEYESVECYQSTAKSPTMHSEMYNTAGCTSTPLPIGDLCGPGGYMGAFHMSDGVLTTSWDWVEEECEMPTEKMLVITEPSTITLDATTTTAYYDRELKTTDREGEPTTVGRYITSTISPSATAQANFTLSADEVKSYGTFTHISYFSAIFLAPMLAVLIRAFWGVSHASFKLVEPFQRLSDSGAASGQCIVVGTIPVQRNGSSDDPSTEDRHDPHSVVACDVLLGSSWCASSIRGHQRTGSKHVTHRRPRDAMQPCLDY